MKKNKTSVAYVCQSCGTQYSKWEGKCRGCGEWNTLAEERVAPQSSPSSNGRVVSRPEPIVSVQQEHCARYPTRISEWDTVLGGGLVPGSVVLLGGEPGVGKSTLLLQAAQEYVTDQPVLYVSGEESASQIGLRARRLGITSEKVLVVAENRLEAIEDHVAQCSPRVLIIDSVQTVRSDALDSGAGSVGQLRECTDRLISLAKHRNISTILVGHVTKEGAIAGPKILEHMVDVVLYFEGTVSHSFRLLRAIKNRFGSTNEVAVFEMTENQIRQVTNPSELFLAEKPDEAPGSVITTSLEGTRPLLVEVQGLVSPTSLAMPRRTAIGLDPNRVALLVAILEKRGGYRLFDQDVYINVAGGLRLTEPAADLAVMAALISSTEGRPASSRRVFFGEVGLGGEVRSVPRAVDRLKEASKIGLTEAIVPKRVAQEMTNLRGIEIQPIDHISDLKNWV